MPDPILVTATYSGVLQLWSTTDTQWKTLRYVYPTGNYLVNTLKLDNSRKYLAVGGTNVVKLYDISERDFQETHMGVQNQTNVTALGRYMERGEFPGF